MTFFGLLSKNETQESIQTSQSENMADFLEFTCWFCKKRTSVHDVAYCSVLEMVELLLSPQKYLLPDDVLYCGRCTIRGDFVGDLVGECEGECEGELVDEYGLRYIRELGPILDPVLRLEIRRRHADRIPYVYNLRYRYFVGVRSPFNSNPSWSQFKMLRGPRAFARLYEGSLLELRLTHDPHPTMIQSDLFSILWFAVIKNSFLS